MTADEFKQAIDQLGYSPAGIAKILEINGRTARRWASGANEVPTSVAQLVTVMLAAGGLTPEIEAQAKAHRAAGNPDEATTRFVWVKRLAEGGQWVVAEHDLLANFYYLPGNIDKFTSDELLLGETVAWPQDD